MDRLLQDAASDGCTTPSLMIHDAREHQILSSKDLFNALDSYLQTRDKVARQEKSDPPSQNPNDLNDTTLIIPRTEVDRRDRETQNLRPVNCSGLSELAPLKPTRSRRPSYQKAKTIYEEALRSIREELDEFNA